MNMANEGFKGGAVSQSNCTMGEEFIAQKQTFAALFLQMPR
jgi:hypothetical protein